MANTLCKLQQQSSMESYLTDLKTFIGDSLEEYNSSLLSTESVEIIRQ